MTDDRGRGEKRGREAIDENSNAVVNVDIMTLCGGASCQYASVMLPSLAQKSSTG